MSCSPNLRANTALQFLTILGNNLGLFPLAEPKAVRRLINQSMQSIKGRRDATVDALGRPLSETLRQFMQSALQTGDRGMFTDPTRANAFLRGLRPELAFGGHLPAVPERGR